MKRGIEIFCACGGAIFAVLFGIGFWAIADFVSPLDPNASAEEIAAIYRGDTNAIRTGLLVCYVGLPFYLAFAASISAQTRRIAGVPRTLLDLQIAAYSASLLLIGGPYIIWWVAAYRPEETSAELIRTLNDFGWIAFLIGWVPFVTWYVVTGLAILCDSSAEPIYPRWAGYLSVMMGTGQMSATFLVFFKNGPFAWDGVFSWWAPATWFFIWFASMTVLTIRAINAQYAPSAAAEPEAVLVGGHEGVR
ncbi:hypothetical protein [Sporichthya brevicatena]